MSDHLGQLGTRINPNSIVFSNGSWYITHPDAKGRKGFFSLTADWCHYCQQLAASMQQARKTNPFPSFYMIGDQDRFTQALMTALKAEGYPTIFTFDPQGKLTQYDGERSPASLSSSMTGGSSGSGFFWWL